MIKKINLLACALVLLLGMSPIVWADYEAGETANRAGKREAAFDHFQAAAEQADARAYGKLGSMYLYGVGTPKDYVNAYLWFSMAEEHGDRLAERFRMAASAAMTPEQVEQAHRLFEEKRSELEILRLPAIK